MAYIKYKELTKYFNFESEIDSENLPKYVLDYIHSSENILIAYKTARDFGIFTDKRMILFDKNPLSTIKKTHVIPYNSISTSAIGFGFNTAQILMSLDSGYPLQLNFVKMNDSKKTNLKNVYIHMTEPGL